MKKKEKTKKLLKNQTCENCFYYPKCTRKITANGTCEVWLRAAAMYASNVTDSTFDQIITVPLTGYKM